MERLLKNSRLEILACPKCKEKLSIARVEGYICEPYANNYGDIFFICENCNVGYPICNDLPVFLEERAFPLPNDRAITIKKSL